KVYWPAEGYTKGDLIRHYEQVADLLLPYLMDRPVHMLRYPDGIEGKSFYQRQAPEGLPEWFPTETVVSRSSDETHRHMVCTSRDAILWLVNMGSIDLHPWMSRVGSLESPDYVVIDLDPGSAPFRDVVRVARVVGRILRGIGAQPALKTSGKSGLHIHVALRRGYSYEQGRMFAEGVARAVCRELPEIATVERNVGSRGSRVYLDFMQNRTGQTVVPPYVVRPVRGAQVSAPLAWDELELAIEPSQFTIQTLPERLARHGDLFRPSLDTGLDLLDAVNALQELLRS
ncbi:MAG: non-homologous end-joining DNA ligase, partial [Planctomycetes bacterium]|nr:non-homologous end-joining DNA ligase [Planctomycetota bacterium]